MSFIQCKDKNEAENLAETMPYCFISPDHRIYSEIVVSGDGMFSTMNAEVVAALESLKCNIEMCSGEQIWEMGFQDLEDQARSCTKAYDHVLKLLRKVIKK